MKRLLILFIVSILFSITTIGQEASTKYYNAAWKELKKNRGKYVREISKINDSVYYIQDFLKEGMTIEMKGYYNSISPFVENGPIEYFDKFGNQIMKGKYCNGELCGIWIASNYIGNIQYAEIDYNFKLNYQKQNEIKETSKNIENSDSILEDQHPDFPGGDLELKKYISRNIIVPYSGFRRGKSGKVIIKFVINEDGKVENIRIAESCYKDYDKEAARVIRNMPIWKPGIQNGSKVKVDFTVPISFNVW